MRNDNYEITTSLDRVWINSESENIARFSERAMNINKFSRKDLLLTDIQYCFTYDANERIVMWEKFCKYMQEIHNIDIRGFKPKNLI